MGEDEEEEESPTEETESKGEAEPVKERNTSGDNNREASKQTRG